MSKLKIGILSISVTILLLLGITGCDGVKPIGGDTNSSTNECQVVNPVTGDCED